MDLKDIPIGMFEYNAGRFTYGRGIQYALEMNISHRNADVITHGCLTNATQPWDMYGTDWKAVCWIAPVIHYT